MSGDVLSENPVRTLRKASGKSRAELSRASGAGYHSLTLAENGYCRSLSSQVLSAIRFLGGDPASVQSDYQAWLHSLRKD